jgi:hypothetical protein
MSGRCVRLFGYDQVAAPPLSRITDRNGNDGSKFGTAACQYVSEDRETRSTRASLV